MNRMNGQAADERLQAIGHALLILPAVSLGILAMIPGGVSPLLWGQQAAAFLVFALLAQPLRCALRRIPFSVKSALLLLLLSATLLFEEVKGVRRWLDLGALNVHAATLVLPALLAMLCSMKLAHPVLLGTAAILCIQPDMSQLTAFFLAMLPLLWNHRRNKLWTYLSVLTLTVLMIRCACVPVILQPVEYCEGILTMLGNVSWLLQAIGVASLAAIPVFWGIQFIRLRQIQLLCYAIYYAVTMLFILTGDYPVPFMGFGLSPIAGHFLAYICCEPATRKASAA